MVKGLREHIDHDFGPLKVPVMVFLLLMALILPGVSALASETAKDLLPGKGLDLTNKSGVAAIIGISAEEGRTYDYVLYPQKGEGDPTQEISSINSSIEIPSKARFVITASKGNADKLTVTFESVQFTFKEAAKPALERYRLTPGTTMEIAGTGYSREIRLITAEDAGLSYDLAVYSDKTTLERMEPGFSDETLTVPATGRVLISVPQGAKGFEAVYDLQGLKVSFPKEPGIKRSMLEPGKNLEIKNAMDAEKTVMFKSESGILADYVILQNNKTVSFGRSASLSDLTIPAKGSAIVSLLASSEGSAELVAEGIAFKIAESARPAFLHKVLESGKSLEVTNPVDQEAVIYLGAESGTPPYAYAFFTLQGKPTGQQEEQATGQELTLPGKTKVVITASPGETPLEVALDPTTLKQAVSTKPAFTREEFVTGKSFILKGSASEETRVRLDTGDSGPEYDMAVYDSKGILQQAEEAVASREIIIPPGSKAVVTSRQSGKAFMVFNTSSVTVAESKVAVFDRKSLNAGENAEFKNTKDRPVSVRWFLKDSNGEVPLDYTVMSKGKPVDQGFASPKSSVEIPGNGVLAVSIPAGVEGATASYDPSVITYAKSAKPAVEKYRLQPGDSIEVTNPGKEYLNIYTDAGVGRSFDYAVVTTDGFPTRVLFARSDEKLGLNSREKLCLTVPQDGKEPITITIGGSGTVQLTKEAALRRRLVKPGQGISYGNNMPKEQSIMVMGVMGPDGNQRDASFMKFMEGSLIAEGEIEAETATSQDIRVDKNSRVNLFVPSSAQDPVWVAGYEPLFTTEMVDRPTISIYPGSGIRFKGSVRTSSVLKSYSLVVKGGVDPGFSRVLATATVPNVTDINLMGMSYQAKDSYLASPGEYMVSMKGISNQGAEVDLAGFTVKVVSIFDLFQAEYQPDKDMVKVKAVIKPGILESVTQNLYDLPVMLGVKDPQSSISALSFMGTGQQLTKTEPNTYEGEIPGDKFPRGRLIRVWPYALGVSMNQDAPEGGSISLTISSMPPSAVSAMINWEARLMEIKIKSEVTMDIYGSKKQGEQVPYRYTALLRVPPMAGMAPTTPLATYSGELVREKYGDMTASIPLAGIARPQGQNLEFLVGVEPSVQGTPQGVFDELWNPINPPMVKVVPYPLPAMDPGQATLMVDQTAGKARVSGRISAVPEGSIISLGDGSGKEWRVRMKREEPTDLEAFMRADFLITEIGFDPLVPKAYYLSVRDSQGVEMLKQAIVTVLAPLPRIKEDDDLFYDSELDGMGMPDMGSFLKMMPTMPGAQAFPGQVAGGVTAAPALQGVPTVPGTPQATPGGQGVSGFDMDSIQKLLESMGQGGGFPVMDDGGYGDGEGNPAAPE